MKIQFEMAGTRVEGTIEGKPFVITRQGCETSIDMFDESTFGGMVASKLLDFCSTVMDGINVVVDATDELNVWEELDEELAEEVYDALM